MNINYSTEEIEEELENVEEEDDGPPTVKLPRPLMVGDKFTVSNHYLTGGKKVFLEVVSKSYNGRTPDYDVFRVLIGEDNSTALHRKTIEQIKVK